MLPAEKRVYLDHNASTPLIPGVKEAISHAFEDLPGNPSSPHSFGHKARLALEKARGDVARLIGATPSEIVFVSGGTEADNLAVQSPSRAAGPSRHIVTSAIEHPAVLETCRGMERNGWRLTVVGVDRKGRVDPDMVEAALEPGTALVAIMGANNETGVVQPIEEIGKVLKTRRIPFHVDAVQLAGRRPIDVARLGADTLALSSHKIGGPVGIGALYVRRGASLFPLHRGGGQEGRRRPGTEAVALAVGFAAAARAWNDGDAPARMKRLRDTLEKAISAKADAIVNGCTRNRLPNTTSLTFPGVDNESLVIRMDLRGFAISTGSACSTGSARPSHVLAAMGLKPEVIGSTVRVSLGPATTEEEIDRFAKALCDEAGLLAKGSGTRRAKAV